MLRTYPLLGVAGQSFHDFPVLLRVTVQGISDNIGFLKRRAPSHFADKKLGFPRMLEQSYGGIVQPEAHGACGEEVRGFGVPLLVETPGEISEGRGESRVEFLDPSG
jgi:hypothetical protein